MAVTINNSIYPATVDTPLDDRAFVQREADILNINNPKLGATVYAIQDKKEFRITSLKPKVVAGQSIPNKLVDTYEQIHEFKPSEYLSRNQVNQLFLNLRLGYDPSTSTISMMLGDEVLNSISITTDQIPVQGIFFKEENVGLAVGASYTAQYTILPANATNTRVTFSSSNPSVATVNSTTGYIKAIANGTAEITITIVDGGRTFTDTMTVRVADFAGTDPIVGYAQVGLAILNQ